MLVLTQWFYPASLPTPASVPIAAPVLQPQLLPQQPPVEKPTDYVHYERHLDDLSSEAHAHATVAKVKLRPHYRFALETSIDLIIRCVCSSACMCCDIDLTAFTWMSLVCSVFAVIMIAPCYLEAESSRDPLQVYQRTASCLRSGSIRARSCSF